MTDDSRGRPPTSSDWPVRSPYMADKTSSVMTIDVPKPVIMAVITDFAAYPQWASGIKEAQVMRTDTGGRPERVRFTLDTGIIKDRYVLGYVWREAEVRWELVERGGIISDMSGAYLLSDAPGGGTKVTYELAVGLSMPMPGIAKRRAEKTIIDTALKGLKGRAKKVADESGEGT